MVVGKNNKITSLPHKKQPISGIPWNLYLSHEIILLTDILRKVFDLDTKLFIGKCKFFKIEKYDSTNKLVPYENINYFRHLNITSEILQVFHISFKKVEEFSCEKIDKIDCHELTV